MVATEDFHYTPPVAQLAEARQWDMYAHRYEARRRNDEVYLASVRAVIRALGPTAGPRILDAGCGTGFAVRHLARADRFVTGLDLSVASLRRLAAERLPNVTLVPGSVTQLPFADGAFDAVLCANVLQQLREPGDVARSISELGRVVRIGGRVVVSVHHYSAPKRRRGDPPEGPAGNAREPVAYLKRYRPEEFRALFRGGPLRLTRLFGAGHMCLPYRYKLSPLSRVLEPLLQRFRLLRDQAHMLVAVCERAD